MSWTDEGSGDDLEADPYEASDRICAFLREAFPGLIAGEYVWMAEIVTHERAGEPAVLEWAMNQLLTMQIEEMIRQSTWRTEADCWK